MNLNSPLFDRIRLKSSPQQTADVEQPKCDYPGCAGAGLHRAPKGRMREGQYFCFCLDHVRAYNQSYNYFNGMSDEDVLRYQRDAETGHRPTWTMGVNRAARSRSASAYDFRSRAAYGEDGPNFYDPSRSPAAERPRSRYGAAALKSLEALGLDDSADAETIKARYKELIKRLHPDANGGDRSSEDRLREIIHAYKHLRAAALA